MFICLSLSIMSKKPIFLENHFGKHKCSPFTLYCRLILGRINPIFKINLLARTSNVSATKAMFTAGITQADAKAQIDFKCDTD